MSDQLQKGTNTRPQISRVNGALQVTHSAGDPSLGQYVEIELHDPANAAAVYTVPGGKSFSGQVVIDAQITAAGGSLGLAGTTPAATVAASAPSAQTCVCDVTAPATTAITVAMTNAKGKVTLVGYVK